MLRITVVVALIVALAAAQVQIINKPPYTPLPDTPQCPTWDANGGTLWAYDHLEGPPAFGFFSHNDYLPQGDHYYSFSNPAAGVQLTLDLVAGTVSISGVAWGGIPAGAVTISYQCASASGTVNNWSATNCAGFYIHNGNNIPIMGMASNGAELIGYIKSVAGGDHNVVEGWFSFHPLFDPNGVSQGDFKFNLGCGPYCGDGVVDEGEQCDPGADVNCRDDCTGPQNPQDPCPEFDLDQCYDSWSIKNGNVDGGAYLRNSPFWGADYTPRSWVQGTFDFCAEDDVLSISGYIDGGVYGACFVEYSCTDVDVPPNTPVSTMLGATGCSGSVTCDGITLDVSGKESASGYEFECWNKYGDWKCMGWIMWTDNIGGAVVGDLVFIPFCPEEEVPV